jgi:hypothetical protein
MSDFEEKKLEDAVVSDDDVEGSPDTPLAAEGSAESAPVVQEFMAEAAEANKAAAVESAEDSAMAASGGLAGAEFAMPMAPYIAFEHVYKSFGDLLCEPGRDALYPGPKWCGQVGFVADSNGVSQGGCWNGSGGGSGYCGAE